MDTFAVSKLAKCLICYSPSVLLCEAVALADVSLKGSECRSNQPKNSIRTGLRSSAGPPLHQLKCLSFKQKTCCLTLNQGGLSDLSRDAVKLSCVSGTLSEGEGGWECEMNASKPQRGNHVCPGTDGTTDDAPSTWRQSSDALRDSAGYIMWLSISEKGRRFDLSV